MDTNKLIMKKNFFFEDPVKFVFKTEDSRDKANLSRHNKSICVRSALRKLSIFSIMIVFVIIVSTVPVLAARVYIPPITGKAGNTVKLPIVIDRAEQIAGIKLVINYDKEVLAFQEGNKTKASDSLMHIVNDKQPGRLVVVMAGAKGISGKELTVFVLGFTIKNRPESKNTNIEIKEVQLMNENLKDVKAETSAGLITID